MNCFYFETSAINHLVDHYDNKQIVFIRDFLKAIAGAQICLSPVSMWEILCTGDPDRKARLIQFCQQFFDQFVLFPDPIQILDHFISTGCKLIEPEEGFWGTEGSFQAVWNEIAGNYEKTIVVDGDLKKIDKEIIKRVSKIAISLIQSGFSPDAENDDIYYQSVCNGINNIYVNLPFVIEDKKLGICENGVLHKVSIMFALLVLVAGVSFGDADPDTFWAKRNAVDIQERLNLLFTDYETAIYRGPLASMAIMAVSQSRESSNRGLYKDCLHAMYMPYCTSFFTADAHFLQLAKEDPAELWGRIVSIQSFCGNLFYDILPKYLNRDETNL